MKKKLFLILTLMLISTSLISAQYDCYTPSCCETVCCSKYRVYADYLYWRVCETDLTFFRNENTTSITEYLNPCYDSGWRVGGSFSCGCGDIGIRYTDYCNREKREITDPPFDTEGTAVFDFDYKVLDIELGYLLSFDCDRYNLRPFAGAKFAWIDESFDDVINDVSNQDFNGYGLYFGAEGYYQLCKSNVCCSELEFSLHLRGSYGILDASSKTKNIGDSFDNIRERECLFITTVEVFAGLGLKYICSDRFAPEVIIGYEANSLLGWREMDSSNDISSLGLGGLVARLQVGF